MGKQQRIKDAKEFIDELRNYTLAYPIKEDVPDIYKARLLRPSRQDMLYLKKKKIPKPRSYGPLDINPLDSVTISCLLRNG